MRACMEYLDVVVQGRRSSKTGRVVAQLVRDLAVADASHLNRAVVAMRVAEEAEHLARVEVAAARALGATWQEVGDALGTNRQAAHERFREGPDGGRSRLSRRPQALQSRRDSTST
jgi:hypothetical protein